MAEVVDITDFKSAVRDEQVVDSSSRNGSLDELNTAVKMHKRYNFTSLFAMFVVVGASWEAIVSSLFQILVAGGPATLVWGYVLSAFGAICIALSLAEFASIWPSAAGQYHWAVALAPSGWEKAVGWYSAWILLFLNILASLSAVFAGGLTIQGLIIITQTNYTSERWHTYMIILAIIVVCLIVNIFTPRALHYVSVVGTVAHVLGFFAVIITLLATTKEKNSAKVVFATFTDDTGYNNRGIAFLIGLLPTASGFTGMDTCARYSEETAKPHTDVPRAMFWGVLTNAIIGLPFVLVIAFCMGDPASLLTSRIAQHSPFVQIVYTSTGSLGAAIVLGSVIVVVAVIAALDAMGAIARIIMAQARDQALPFSNIFSKIDAYWNTPINALILAATLQAAIATIYIGNSTAYFGIVSGVLTLQVISYGIPIAFHLFQRKTLNLEYGPWKLGRWGGRVANLIGLVLYIFLFVAVSLPTEVPVTASNMNYAAPIAGMILVLAMVLYLVWGRRAYYGPLIFLSGVKATAVGGLEIPPTKET